MLDRPPDYWTIYVLRMADNSLYCGITTHLGHRLKAHDAGPPNGSKYVHSHKPYDVVMTEVVIGRSAALKKEAAFKKLSKAKKEKAVYEGVKHRAWGDAFQDRCEGVPWASVGGSKPCAGDQPKDMVFVRPKYITAFDEMAYFEGYRECMRGMFGEEAAGERR